MGTKQQQRFDTLADLGAPTKAPARRVASMPAPVRMMDFKADPDATKQERLEGVQRRATTVRQIDAALVRRSRFANRHPDEFRTAEYQEFAADIKATAGNTIPGKVRKLHGDEEGRFELIFGHRRHQACLELGLPFLAEICEADDRTLFEEMTRENLFRKDPTPWDWAQHYAAGLKDLYGSQDDLCRANGKSKSHVSQALQLAQLPAEVVEAFASPVALQLAWGALLQDALKANRDAVLKRAGELKGSGKSAAETFRELVGSRERRAKVSELKVHGREVGTVSFKNGVVQVKLKKRTLAADQLHEFRTLIQGFLAERLAE
jgi:ParB family chromosome partitioning protein